MPSTPVGEVAPSGKGTFSLCVLSMILGIVLVIAGMLCYWLYREYRSVKTDSTVQSEKAQGRKKDYIDPDKVLQEQRDREIKQKEEAEAKRKQEEQRQEAKRREEEQRKIAEEKARKDAEERARREAEQNAVHEAEQRGIREKERIALLFSNRMALLKKYPIKVFDTNEEWEETFGRSKATLFIPEDSGVAVYAFGCGSNSVIEVIRCYKDHEDAPLPASEIAKAVKMRGGLLVDENRSILRAPESSRLVRYPIPKDGKPFNPSAMYFGSQLPFLERCGLDMSGINFSVYLNIGRDEREQIGVVGFDCTVKTEEIRNCAERYLKVQKIEKAQNSFVPIKKPKVDTVMYDGEQIKKDIKGITYVPNVFRYPSGYEENAGWSWYHSSSDGKRCNCNRCKIRRKAQDAKLAWEKLKAKAEMQERELANYKEAVRVYIEKAKKNVKVGANEIDRLLRASKISFEIASEADSNKKLTTAQENECIPPDDPPSSLEITFIGDRISSESLARLNAELKYPTFCGLRFGSYAEEPSLQGKLDRKFRHFEDYSLDLTRKYRRINRITLNCTLDKASRKSYREEFDSVVQILSRKYAFDRTNKSEDGDSLFSNMENDFIRLTVSGNYNDECSRYTIRFLNKQVAEQDDSIRKPDSGNDIALPDDAGADVL